MTNDIFENWNPEHPFDRYEWEDETKTVESLIEELKKERPPTYKGQRVPFAVFHHIGIRTTFRPVIDDKGNYVRGADGLALKTKDTKKIHKLVMLPLNGTHGTTSKIDFYHTKGTDNGAQGLVYWWFPNKGGPNISLSNNVEVSTSVTTGGADLNGKYRRLRVHCENRKGVSHQLLKAQVLQLNEEREARKALEEKLKILQAKKEDKNKV